MLTKHFTENIKDFLILDFEWQYILKPIYCMSCTAIAVKNVISLINFEIIFYTGCFCDPWSNFKILFFRLKYEEKL